MSDDNDIDPFAKAPMLECLDRALAVSEANGREPIRVTHAELTALVAAARERDELEAAHMADELHRTLADEKAKTLAAEKERDELRAKVAELVTRVAELDAELELSNRIVREYEAADQSRLVPIGAFNGAHQQGRRAERAAIVAWLRESATEEDWADPHMQDALSVETDRIERGEHVRLADGGRAGQD